MARILRGLECIRNNAVVVQGYVASGENMVESLCIGIRQRIER